MATDSVTTARVPDGEDVWGSHTRANTWDITPSNSYPTGGYTITPHRFGYSTVRGAVSIAGNTAAIGYIAWYNKQTGKLVVLTGALAQVTANTDLSSLQFRVTFFGE